MFTGIFLFALFVQGFATRPSSPAATGCAYIPRIEVQVPDDLLGLSIRDLISLVEKLANERNILHHKLVVARTTPPSRPVVEQGPAFGRSSRRKKRASADDLKTKNDKKNDEKETNVNLEQDKSGIDNSGQDNHPTIAQEKNAVNSTNMPTATNTSKSTGQKITHKDSQHVKAWQFSKLMTEQLKNADRKQSDSSTQPRAAAACRAAHLPSSNALALCLRAISRMRCTIDSVDARHHGAYDVYLDHLRLLRELSRKLFHTLHKCTQLLA